MMAAKGQLRGPTQPRIPKRYPVTPGSSSYQSFAKNFNTTVDMVDYAFRSLSICEEDEDFGSNLQSTENISQFVPVAPLKAVTKVARTSGRLITTAKMAVSVIQESLPQLVIMELIVLELTHKCWLNLMNWWVGAINGKRCAKKCASQLLKTGMTVGGVVAGAAAGVALMGPAGAVAVGVVGGYLGRKVGQSLAKLLCSFLFQNPKTQAVRNAYDFLGMSQNATNQEINSAYRAKARQYHPDKDGGNTGKFHQLQMALAVIKLHRGNGTCKEAEGKVSGAICY